MIRVSCRGAGSAAIAFVVLLSTGSVAHADRVVVKGDTLQGTVQSITKQEIVLETIYGDGTLVIAVEDVGRLRGSEGSRAGAAPVRAGSRRTPLLERCASRS